MPIWPLTLTHSHTHTLTHTHTHSHSFTLTHSLSLIHSHSFTLNHSHTLPQTGHTLGGAVGLGHVSLDPQCDSTHVTGKWIKQADWSVNPKPES